MTWTSGQGQLSGYPQLHQSHPDRGALGRACQTARRAQDRGRPGRERRYRFCGFRAQRTTAMNLSKRGKWLTGIAALIAAYVAFGPKDSDSVEPARATAAAPVHAPRAATTLSAPVARSLLALARSEEHTSE